MGKRQVLAALRWRDSIGASLFCVTRRDGCCYRRWPNVVERPS